MACFLLLIQFSLLSPLSSHWERGENSVPLVSSRPANKPSTTNVSTFPNGVAPKQESRGAFVILAQNKPHPRYARDSNACLKRTLDFFYKNYNSRFHDDVVIVHEGDFDDAAQTDLRQGRGPELKFHTLAPEDWEIFPPSLRGTKIKTDYLGYRHMVRFFSIRIWPLLSRMGYKYIARLDDDSLILSEISYSLFEFMEEHSIDYAYRAFQNEDIEQYFWLQYHQ
jgi:hypothetical protein